MEIDNQFKPGSTLTFQTIATIRKALYKALKEKSENFYFDLSEVTLCDSAGLALIIEARKLCKKMNKSFEVQGFSAEIQSLAEFCGVAKIL